MAKHEGLAAGISLKNRQRRTYDSSVWPYLLSNALLTYIERFNSKNISAMPRILAVSRNLVTAASPIDNPTPQIDHVL